MGQSLTFLLPLKAAVPIIAAGALVLTDLVGSAGSCFHFGTEVDG